MCIFSLNNGWNRWKLITELIPVECVISGKDKENDIRKYYELFPSCGYILLPQNRKAVIVIRLDFDYLLPPFPIDLYLGRTNAFSSNRVVCQA